MESTDRSPHLHDDPLKIADRAAAAPFTDCPELPGWYPLAGGAWFAAILGTGAYEWPDNKALRLLVIAVLVAVLGAAVRWYRNASGVEHSLDARKAPPEIGRTMVGYYVGATAALAVAFACWAFAPPVVTVAVTFVLATAGLAVYERRYRQAAEVVLTRLR